MDNIIPQDSPTKQCTYCGKEFPATPEFFHRNKLGRYGLQAECKACARARNKEWRERPGNKEHQQEYQRTYLQRPGVREHYKALHEEYIRRPEVQEHRQVYREEYRSRPGIREHEQARQKTYFQRPDVKEHRRAHRKVYYSRPEIQERQRAYDKVYLAEYRRKNRERLSAKKREAYSHPEVQQQYKATRDAYYQRPEIRTLLKERNQRRRARKLAASGTYTTQDMQAQHKRQKGKCYWCQQPVEWGKHHEDHITPLSRGGTNWPDNMCIACPTCNLKKKDKMPHEWPEGGRLL